MDNIMDNIKLSRGTQEILHSSQSVIICPTRAFHICVCERQFMPCLISFNFGQIFTHVISFLRLAILVALSKKSRPGKAVFDLFI